MLRFILICTFLPADSALIPSSSTVKSPLQGKEGDVGRSVFPRLNGGGGGWAGEMLIQPHARQELSGSASSVGKGLEFCACAQ